jgi:hypothetical protein
MGGSNSVDDATIEFAETEPAFVKDHQTLDIALAN